MPSPIDRLFAALVVLLLGAVPALAQGDVIAALREGGCVIVMRHAHAPLEPPASNEADPGNVARERELDALGKAQAESIGKRLTAGRIPIGQVYSSPTFRALETARLMGFAKPDARDELGDGGASMAPGAAGPAGAAWLRARAAQAPPPHKDALVITHGPNIAMAFGEGLKDLTDGEAAVFRPDGRGGFSLLGRIKPDGW